MKISTKGRYALRLMIDMAEHPSAGNIPLKDISARQGVSIKYLEQIVGQLAKAGLVKSVRGPQGGYRLAQEPEDYRVGDILRVIEGNLAPVSCLDENINNCPRNQLCKTLNFWQGLYDVVAQYVDGVTLADIAEIPLGDDLNDEEKEKI